MSGEPGYCKKAVAGLFCVFYYSFGLLIYHGGITMKIITISREFGSGGRELGKRLADALGINTSGKEIKKLIPGVASYVNTWFDGE